MRKVALILVAIISLSLAGRELKDIPNVHVSDQTRFLSDPDNYISAAATAQADKIMADIWNRTSVEIVAVVVDRLPAGSDPNTFATELFDQWNIGKKDNDNGVLVLVAINDRAAVIRTGYGVEGVLPDITAGQIIRNEVAQAFREGDYDTGLLNGLTAVHTILTDPKAAEELKSKYRNNESQLPFSLWELYLMAGVAVLFIGLIFFIYTNATNKNNPTRNWELLNRRRLTFLSLSVLFLGIPWPAFYLINRRLKSLRSKAPNCRRCSTRMELLQHGDDDKWLSSGQLAERKVGSVEHDVWECPQCNYGEIRSFNNTMSNFTTCKNCGAKTLHEVSDKVLRQATALNRGLGVKTYRCEHCGDQENRPYELPAKTPPVVILPGGRGGGFGGGISGGSFGGGRTGGGGASGRW